MTQKELAQLCRMLDKFFDVCDPSMKGAVETMFYEVWKADYRHISYLEFYRFMLKTSPR